MNMKGDFSRVTFDPTKHFTSVLMQQGRVQVDADWNEQAAIMLWQLRTLARGVIGEFGAVGDGFTVSGGENNSLQAAPGVYFVHGIAVESEALFPFKLPQPTKSPTGAPTNSLDGRPDGQGATWAASLVVWERIITWLDDPTIREIALGAGIDTAVRTQVRWTIVVAPAGEEAVTAAEPTLQIGLDGGAPSTDACNISPDAAYRGDGNQLYRVEIHDSWHSAANGPTFKWSRENASLVYPVSKLDGTTLYVSSVGRDNRLAIHPGDYLEFESTDIGWNQTLPLALVKTVDADKSTVTVDAVPTSFVPAKDGSNFAAVRRWDHSSQNAGGVTPVVEGKAISLEAGLNVTFPAGAAKSCRRGDYWLVAARTGVVWAPPIGELKAVRPEHYVAPLASFPVDVEGTIGEITDLRFVITPIAKRNP